MSTEFQKDLYKKTGSLLTVWDICIGVGLIALGSGVYMHHQEKKGSASKVNKMEDIKKGMLVDSTPKEDSEHISMIGEKPKMRSQIKTESRMPKRDEELLKKPERHSASEKDTLSKLGL
jgi:hypothetical protein